MEGNNAPFAVGQRVVAIKDGFWMDESEKILKAFSKGDEFSVLNIWYCCRWRVDIGQKADTEAECHCCGKKNGIALWASASLFAPINPYAIDLTKEIADSFKQTEEVPDKALVPEKSPASIENQFLEGNEEMIKVFNQLSPEDQKLYAPRVAEMIELGKNLLK